MPRLDISEHADLVDVLTRRYGVLFRRVGANWLARCPLPGHTDSDPSFTVFARDNRFRCFGCDRAGDVLDAVRAIEGLPTVNDAVLALEQRPEWRTRPAASAPPVIKQLSSDEISAVGVAVAWYAQCLERDAEALDYLRSRGIGLDFARTRVMGACRATAPCLRPLQATDDHDDGGQMDRSSTLRARLIGAGVPPEAARSAGLVSPTGWEVMRDRLVLPHLQEGRAVWLCGRLMDTPSWHGRREQARAVVRKRVRTIIRWLAIHPGDTRHDDQVQAAMDDARRMEYLVSSPRKYLNMFGPKPMFGLPDQPVDTLFIVEGPLDQVALSQWGYQAAATLGSHFSMSQLVALSRFRFTPILRDAGDNGLTFARNWQVALGESRSPIIDPPSAVKDAGEMATRDDGKDLAAVILGPFLGGGTAQSGGDGGLAVGDRLRLMAIRCPHCSSVTTGPGPAMPCCGSVLEKDQMVEILDLTATVRKRAVVRFHQKEVSA
ncbi:MAG: CHC2 zinc finger domain-containing protein [Chloroflexota bacterium]